MSGDLAFPVAALSVLAYIVGTGAWQTWQDRRRAPVHRGWRALPDDPELLVRLGLVQADNRVGLLDGKKMHQSIATDVRVRDIDGFSVLAAHVPERTTFRRYGSFGRTGTYTLCALTLPVPLPVLDLRPVHRAGGDDPPAAVSAERLLRERRAFAPSEWWARTLERPEVVAAIGSGAPEAGLQVLGNQLLSTRRGRLDPEEVDVRIAWLVRVARSLTAEVHLPGS